MASDPVKDEVNNHVASKDAFRSESKGSVHHDDTMVELHEPYVKPGFRGMFQSPYVVLCAFVVRLGGFLFGYGMPLAPRSSLAWLMAD